ncbi:MAG: GNAT family N-acetyltransferase [Halolamina sp.]
MGTLRRRPDSTEYAVRTYDDSDLDGILALYETVFGKSRGRAWFEWRYDTPYVEEPQVVVAAQSGSVVGAVPFITFRFETGEGSVLAVQPADAMVHPDHRRRGLLTRMSEFAIEHYTPREPAFVFNFPNRQAVDAFRKLGWRAVPDVSAVHRVHHPGRFVSVNGHPRLQRTLDSGGQTVTNALYGLLDRRGGDERISVDRHRSLPVATLVSLYQRSVPDALHASRDATFFEWRLGNPDWTPTTYVAKRRGVPVAAVVTVTEETNDRTFTKVMEALPMAGQGVDDALGRLLAAVCRDHDASDVVKMAHQTVPRSVSRRFGFLRGDRPPLQWLTRSSTMVVRPLDSDGDRWTVGGQTLTSLDDWQITYSEQDTAY